MHAPGQETLRVIFLRALRRCRAELVRELQPATSCYAGRVIFRDASVVCNWLRDVIPSLGKIR